MQKFFRWPECGQNPAAAILRSHSAVRRISGPITMIIPANNVSAEMGSGEIRRQRPELSAIARAQGQSQAGNGTVTA
jgi:hypothetical protein